MRYLVLACDYDGTIAHDGVLNDTTRAALERCRASGRKVVLVTGRELDDLQRILPDLQIFDKVVAENGALLYNPGTREERPLGERPPEAFITRLREQGVPSLSVGRVIVATWEPHENTVLDAIRDLGLELQVIFNKGAVMVLPSGVNKATGLKAALDDLDISPHNAVGVGDAENDHAFLRLCEASVAVANALPMVKETADWTTTGDHGDGVRELIDHLLADDLAVVAPRLTRYHVSLGKRADNSEEMLLPAYGGNVLLAGTSGGGKTTLATGIMERLLEKGYQLCILDPEGDYPNLANTTGLGTPDRAPKVEEILALLEKPEQNAVVNLLGVPLNDRPAFFADLLPRLQTLRTQTGHPHWIVVDEAHHTLPAACETASLVLPPETVGLLFITVEPEHVAQNALSLVTMVLAIGDAPQRTIGSFCKALGKNTPETPSDALPSGEAIVWVPGQGVPVRIVTEPPKTERQRHVRKYAEGTIPAENSFYFKGPKGALNLRAQNLTLFLQMADGVDDDTWLFHLHKGDYSRWFRRIIKDEDLADEAAKVEKQRGLSAKDSHALIREAVERRYTAPA